VHLPSIYTDVPPVRCSHGCACDTFTELVALASEHLRTSSRCPTCSETTIQIYVLSQGRACPIPEAAGCVLPEIEFVLLRLFYCESGCEERAPIVTRMETAGSFLRLHFWCVECQGKYSRIYDTLAGGYVLFTGGRMVGPGQRYRPRNWGKYRGQFATVDDRTIVYSQPSDTEVSKVLA
jgi:hypothetical protein